MLLPYFTLAQNEIHNPPQTATLYWRWKDEGSSDVKDARIYAGEATATWSRNAHCRMGGVQNGYQPIMTESAVDLKAMTRNRSGDFMDPKSKKDHLWHVKTTSKSCDLRHRIDFTIYKGGDRSQRMIIRLPDICTDVTCSDSSIPNVQCLKGPRGKIVQYNGKWIDECFEP